MKTRSDDYPNLHPHPVIAKLSTTRDPVVMTAIEGYIGSSSEETLRLHPTFNVDFWFEIPREAITSVEDTDGNDGTVRVVMSASTTVSLIERARLLAGQLRNCSDERPPNVAFRQDTGQPAANCAEKRANLQGFYNDLMAANESGDSAKAREAQENINKLKGNMRAQGCSIYYNYY